MGWTSVNKPKGMSLDEFFDKEFKCDSLKFIGKGYTKNLSEYYRACYNVEKGVYFALVCKIHFGKGYYNFSYKDMDESENPYLYNCPRRIMGIIDRSQPINEYAKKWREQVHKILDIKLKTGTIVQFPDGIIFGGRADDTFKYLGAKKFLSMKYGIVVHITRWKTYTFKEIVS